MIDLLAGMDWAILTHGCPDAANVSNTLSESRFLDAAVCPYSQRLTMPIFAAFVMVGIVNLPIYIKQDSVMIPFVLTLVVGGVVLSTVASILQGIAVTLLLFTIGIGPILVLRRVMRG